MRNELKWLPYLGPHLPLAVPVPEFVGQPGKLFGWPYGGYRLVDGVGADEMSGLDDTGHGAALGAFLSALHSVPVPDDAPDDAIGRSDRTNRLTKLCAQWPDAPARVLSLAKELSTGGDWSGDRVFNHGDLYGRHLLVDSTNALSGVIDWGDVHAGDAAVDMMVAWTWLGPIERAIFRDRYGAIDEATWQRARFNALFYGGVMTNYGRGTGDQAMQSLGARALAHVLL